MATQADQRAALAGPGLEGRPAPAARLAAGPGPRFGGLLLILVFTYVLSAFTSGDLINAIQVVLFLAVVLLALRSGRLQHRAVRMIAAALLVGSVAAAIIQLAAPHTPVAGVANLWTALVLLVAVILIVRRVLARPEITLQSIYGAISAYMILGLMFAAVYAAMYHFGGETFFANGQPGNTKTFQYFSFTTLTTLGYGDFTAAESSGQAIAVLEAMAGQIFLATLVARLVAGFRGSSRGASRRASNRPAGAKRASARRATAPAMVRLRPPGAARPRATTTGRAGGRSRAGPGQKPGGLAARQDSGPG
jgi:Ion channel